MAAKGNQEALIGLDKLIEDTHARLVANPDFLTWRALQKARAEILGIKSAPGTPATLFTLEEHAATIVPDAEIRPFPAKVSQLAGAELTLEKVGHPLPVEELMEGAVNEGAVIGGAKPVISFGSSLSKSPKFRSVRWSGGYAWWFADRPLPTTSRREARQAAE